MGDGVRPVMVMGSGLGTWGSYGLNLLFLASSAYFSIFAYDAFFDFPLIYLLFIYLFMKIIGNPFF